MQKKRWISLLLCLALMGAALCGCAQTAQQEEPEQTVQTVVETPAPEATEAPEGPAAADGVYIGSANGYHGAVTLNVTVEGGKIADIEIAEQSETAGIGGRALAVLPDRILEAQTVQVDNISGATITTAAFKAAMNAALEQSGDLEAFSQPLPEVEHTEEELEYDVVVVGSGVAGEAAALSAIESGASVLMLEKVSIIGGTTNASGGAVMGTMSPMNEERGDESEELAQWWYERGEEKVSYEQLLFVTKQSGENVKWLMDLGWKPVLGVGGDSIKEWSHRPDDGTGNKLANGGYTVVDTLHNEFERLGGVTMVDTAATELITNEAGDVIGVIAEGKNTTYTIYAKGGVVLATGGFENDPEMLHTYAPYGEGTVALGANVGDTGDAIRMAQAVGAEIVGLGYTMPSWNFIDGVSAVSKIRSEGRALELNGAMERFLDETVTAEKEKWIMTTQEGHVFYVLVDSQQDADVLAQLDEAAANGVAYKGETLADLAAQLGTDGTALEATVARWNEMAAKGVDEDFGNPNIQALGEGPYYICTIHEGNTGSYGGPKVNTEAEVLREDGTAIPGLYAAGECANGEFFYRDYICGGSSLAMGLAFGRTGGANAAARAK